MEFFASLRELNDWALLILRIGVGFIFFVHGRQKWAMWKMQPSEQMPASLLAVVRLLSIAEPVGGIAVAAGFLTPLAAVGFALVMLGAIDLKARMMRKGFSGEGGWEFEFILLVAAIALFVTGAGAFSLDRVLLRI